MAFERESLAAPQAAPGMAMPFSLEAEQSVLGAILLESSCLPIVTEILPRPDYFYAVNNRLIYGAMQELFTLGRPVDFITVLEKLKENSDFEEATGKVYLTQLAQIVPSIANVEIYANIVRQRGRGGIQPAAGLGGAENFRYPPGEEHAGAAASAGNPAGDLRPLGQAEFPRQGQIQGHPHRHR